MQFQAQYQAHHQSRIYGSDGALGTALGSFFSFFFRVCASRSPGGHGEEHAARGRALHIESAPLAENSKQIPKKSTQIGEFSTRLSHSYTILKRLFAFTMRPPPKQSVQICQLFHMTLPKRLLQFFASSMTSGHLCAILADFHLKFPRLTQNTCVTASLAYDPCHNHFFFESAHNTRL